MLAPTVWTPSLARTLVASSPSGALRGVTVARTALSWPSKAAVEQLDYTLDLTAWLADGADSAVSLVVAIAPSGNVQDLAIVWQLLLNGRAIILLGGGQPGLAYLVTLQVATTNGRIALFDIALQMTADPA